MNFDNFLQIITVASVSAIGYLVKSIHNDLKDLRSDNAKLWTKVTVIEQTTAKDIASMAAITNERMANMNDNLKKQTDVMKEMALQMRSLDRSIQHLKNSHDNKTV
jgi:hypothetical protein